MNDPATTYITSPSPAENPLQILPAEIFPTREAILEFFAGPGFAGLMQAAETVVASGSVEGPVGFRAFSAIAAFMADIRELMQCVAAGEDPRFVFRPDHTPTDAVASLWALVSCQAGNEALIDFVERVTRIFDQAERRAAPAPLGLATSEGGTD